MNDSYVLIGEKFRRKKISRIQLRESALNNWFDGICCCYFSELRYDSLCKQIIRDMNMYGMCVVDDFLGMTYGLGILNEGNQSIPLKDVYIDRHRF